MTWERLAIGDLLLDLPNNKVVQQGWSPKCHTHPATQEKWGVLKTTAIQAGRFLPEHNKELPDTLEPRSNIEVKVGDLLLTCAGPRARCGAPALVRATPTRLMMSGKMYRLRPDERLDARFLELYLLSDEAQKRIDEMKTGISDSGLNLTHGRFIQLQVPVPPLEEQLRIVAILEDHLSHLDAANASAHQAIRRSRALVVSSMGTAIRAAASEAQMETIGDHAARVDYGTSAKCHEVAGDNDIPVLRMGNIQDGRVDWSNLKYLFREHDDLKKLVLHRGDLVFNRTNSAELVGKTAVFESDRQASFASYLIRVRMRPTVDPEWANMAINSPQGRDYIATCVTQQVGQANVNGTKLKAFPLPVPSIERQRALVSQHRDTVESAERLRQTAVTALTRSTALRRALLAAAFAGRLTGSSNAMSDAQEMIGA